MTSASLSPALAQESPADAAAFSLSQFLPYRLSVASNRISRALARRYQDAFGLSIPEWRVMAALGELGAATAADVAAATEMDKVAVSRALARLRAAGRVTLRPDPEDGRKQIVRLSRKGEAVRAAIIPLALDTEARLLAALSPADRRALDAALAALSRAAADLDPPPSGPCAHD